MIQNGVYPLSMKLLRNPKSAVYGVIVFVAVLLLLFAVHSHGAEQTLAFEGGARVSRAQTASIGITAACVDCGPVGTSFEYGFDLIGDSPEYGDTPNVIQLRAQLVDRWKQAELGIGFYYLNHPLPFVCDRGFHLMARWRPTDRFAVQWRHSSTGGTCKPNSGMDLVHLSWNF